MLQAFFDETGGDETKDLTAVAGFVYDKAGLAEFTNAWEPQVQELAGSYRTSSCNAGAAPFSPPNWPDWRRQNLIDSLTNLTSDHALAGFVVATRKCDFEDALENGPGIAKLIDSPYALCLMGVLSLVSHWTSETAAATKVYCRFEDGGYHQKETQELVGRFRATRTPRRTISISQTAVGTLKRSFRHSAVPICWLGSGNGMFSGHRTSGQPD